MSTQTSPRAGGERAVRPFGMRDKVGYMFGDFGNDFSFILQLLFFMLFYTKVVGIEPAHVGTLFLVARVLDAFTDFGMGRIVDIVKPTKAGKFRPWIARGAVPVAVASALMYQSFVAGWDSYGARLAWMCVTYVLWGSITYTMINIPYGSMASVISDEEKPRAELSVWRSTGAQLAMLCLSVGMPYIVYDQVQGGGATLSGSKMTMAAIVCSVLAVVFYALCYFMVTERIAVKPAPPGERMTLGKLAGSLLTNRALIGLVLAALLLLVGNFLISGMLGYVVLDYFGDRTLQSTASMAALLPSFALIVIAPWLAGRFGKRETAVVSMIVGAVVLIGMSFMDFRDNTLLWIVFYALSQFMIAIFNFLVWAFVVDVIDYQEVHTGERNDATVYAVYSWARKLGQALAGGVSGWALGWVGYQASTGSEVVQQSEETLSGIYMYSTMVPGLFLIGVAVVLQFIYPLSKKAIAENTAILRERRAAKVAQDA